METESLFEGIKFFLASFGGAAVAIAALANWLGKVWANRILEKERASHSRDLENYRNQLEITRSTLSRYHESQFSLYNALWGSLHDLKLAGDSLWELANTGNLNRFTTQLKNTEDTINKNALLIEDGHLKELKRLINAFWNFQIGKETLIEFYGRSEGVWNEQIRQTISQNQEIREEYSQLIFVIASSFKRQLRGRHNKNE